MNKIYILWGAILLKIIGGGFSDVAYILLAVFSLWGERQVIQALFVSWLFGMLNNYIFNDGSYSAVLRFVVIIACFVSVAARINFSKNFLLVSVVMYRTLAIGFFFMLHSIIFSQVVDVSVMKSVSWFLVMITIMTAWERVSSVDHAELSNILLYSLVAIELFSLAFVFSPAGYITNESGFQGILNQPQAFGPVMAMLAGWLIMKFLSDPNGSWILLLTVLLTLLMVLMSEARTAAFGMIVSVVFTLVVSKFNNNINYIKMFPGLVNPKLGIVAMGMVFSGVLFSSFVYEKIDDFINKRGTATAGFSDAYDQSRGFLIRDMLTNIEKNVFFGIGFGVGSWPDEMVIVRDPVFDIPTSAAIEKGVMPLAVFEETGLFGGVLFLIWIYGLFRTTLRYGVINYFLLTCIFILNLGESTLFSAGGLGLIMLMIIGMISTNEVK